MICPYCETKQNQNLKRCEFCDAKLYKERPTKNPYLSEADAELPQPTLEKFHTLDLIFLLRFLRQERTTSYKLMQTVNKAPESVSIDEGTLNHAQQDYRHYTARMKVIENILIDRLGYKPQRIDNKLISSLEAKTKKHGAKA